MLRLVKVLDVVMITLPFAACWIWYYAAKTPMDGTWQGHAVILGLYAVLFILLGKTYDAFWMSMQRVSELMYGQVLAAMATDGIFYIVICLMATKLCNLLPGIAAIAGQFVMADIWSAVAHRWYYKALVESFSEKNVVALCVAMHLPPWLSFALIAKAGFSLAATKEQLAHLMILNCMYMRSIDEVNEYLRERGNASLSRETAQDCRAS